MEIVVTLLTYLAAVSFGIGVAMAAVPIPWKFPHYDRQMVVAKVAWSLVIAISLFLGTFWLGQSNL